MTRRLLLALALLGVACGAPPAAVRVTAPLELEGTFANVDQRWQMPLRADTECRWTRGRFACRHLAAVEFQGVRPGQHDLTLAGRGHSPIHRTFAYEGGRLEIAISQDAAAMSRD